MTSSRLARVQLKRPGRPEKHDDVSLAGARFSQAQRQAGRDCARSRPTRIFSIAVRIMTILLRRTMTGARINARKCDSACVMPWR